MRPPRAGHPRAATHSTATVGLALLLSACGGSDAATAAQDRCTALTPAGLGATTLSTVWNADGAVTVSGTALPAHCVVDGQTNARTGVDGKTYAIGFRLRLPDQWNGRFLFMGGGGNDGVIGASIGPNVGAVGAMKPALLEGYAIVSTDGGHTGTSGADFATDPLARIDHAYNAYDKTAVNAKALISQRYGRPADKSYFIGCSGGGRQGMMFTQRFPTYFDGVIAHAPAMRVSSGATVAAMWNNQQLSAIAPLRNGAPVLSQAFSDTDLALVSKGILAQCDAADGLADGMVQNFKACGFDAAALQCAGDKTDSCLSAAQVSTLKKLFDGPRTSVGTRLYAGQVMDPGLDQPGWRAWTLGSSSTTVPDSRYNLLMADALRWEFFTPPDPTFQALAFNIDSDPQRMAAYSSVYDTYADDTLAAYKARGGKLMFLHGLADPIFSAHDTVDYYERLAARNGGVAATQAFSRLFAIPGENHCAGGRATDQIDPLTPMVAWVEKGLAPERITAAAAANHPLFANRTRPLCPYPHYARYNGSGPVEDAASFSCTAP